MEISILILAALFFTGRRRKVSGRHLEICKDRLEQRDLLEAMERVAAMGEQLHRQVRHLGHREFQDHKELLVHRGCQE
jgi:transposase